jgi:hypothetical protein
LAGLSDAAPTGLRAWDVRCFYKDAAPPALGTHFGQSGEFRRNGIFVEPDYENDEAPSERHLHSPVYSHFKI